MSGIRVIAGSAKGRKLLLVPGDSTRPITDRVKENLFNILGLGIYDSRFLDLFAGTGSVGIEALSRGAATALFVDTDRKAIQTVHKNLGRTKFENRATVLCQDAFSLLKSIPEAPYQYIFIAPPQYKALWSKTLNLLSSHLDWLAPGGLAIVQIDPKEETPIDLGNLVEADRRRYGNTLLLFFEIV